MAGEYENMIRRSYDGAMFVPVCEKCGRFVKAHDVVQFDYHGQPIGNNATCKACGPTTMPFEGYP